MKKIKLFYLEDCPYCRFARRALKELVSEDARYGEVSVEWVEESEKPEVAERFDYYYVPTVFFGEKKLYEAHPAETYNDVKGHLREALDAVLAR